MIKRGQLRSVCVWITLFEKIVKVKKKKKESAVGGGQRIEWVNNWRLAVWTLQKMEQI